MAIYASIRLVEGSCTLMMIFKATTTRDCHCRTCLGQGTDRIFLLAKEVKKEAQYRTNYHAKLCQSNTALLGAITFSITAFSIMTLSQLVILSIFDIQHE
jgi:hypothetical protein